MGGRFVCPASEAELSERVRTLSARSGAWAQVSPAEIDCLLSETIQGCRSHFDDLLKVAVQETGGPVSSALGGTFVVLSRALLEYRLAFRHLQNGKRPPLGLHLFGGRLVIPFYPHPEIGCDPWILPGAQGWIVPKKGVSREELLQAQAERYFSPSFSRGVGIGLTTFNLAGNGLVDAFYLLLERRLPTILKVSEKTPQFGEVFERLLAPFIKAGVLRIAQGGPEWERPFFDSRGLSRSI